VLRHGSLRNAKLPLDHFDDAASGQLADLAKLKYTGSIPLSDFLP
jgi:hypothetical protein